MEYRKLGHSDLNVSVICQGCWSLVSVDDTWGPNRLEDSIAAIHASLDAGVNFFDTAEVYGDGESEEILGRALEGKRKDVVIATKVMASRLKAAPLKAACEASLRRLRTDYVDLYQIHWPNRDVPVDESLAAMEELRREGKVRHLGVSNFGVSFLGEALTAGPIVSDQLPYSLLWRAIEESVQPLCAENQVSILAYSPLCQSLLTGKFSSPGEVPEGRARMRVFSKGRPLTRHGEDGCEEELFEAIAAIHRICGALGRPMAHVALAWLLARQAVASVVAGSRTAQQARQNAEACDLRLSEDTIAALDAAGESVRKHLSGNPDPWQSDSRFER